MFSKIVLCGSGPDMIARCEMLCVVMPLAFSRDRSPMVFTLVFMNRGFARSPARPSGNGFSSGIQISSKLFANLAIPRASMVLNHTGAHDAAFGDS